VHNIFILIIFSFTLAFSNNLEKMNNIDTYIDIEYKKSKEYFQNKEYEKSYNILKKLFLKDLSNNKINYYLANSAIKIKKFGMASAAYERILINEPSNLKIRFEQAKLLYLTGNTQASIISLKKLLSKDISNNLKKEVQTYLNYLEADKKLFFINTTFLFSLNYMDNVNDAPNQDYILPNFTYLGPQGDDKVSDTSHIEYINVDLIKKFKSSENVIIKNNFSYLKKTFLNEKSENFEAYSYQPGILIKDSFKNYYLGLIFQKYKSGHELSKEYLDGVGLETKFYNKNHMIGLKAERLFYKDEDKSDKNYSSYQLLYNTFYSSGFNFFSRFQKNIAFKSNRTDIDKIVFDNNLSYTFILNDSMSLDPFFRYKMTNYEDESIAFSSRRKDRLSESGLEFRKYLNASSFVSLRGSYLNNHSNHAEYDFKNKSISFIYLKRFTW